LEKIPIKILRTCFRLKESSETVAEWGKIYPTGLAKIPAGMEGGIWEILSGYNPCSLSPR